MSYNLGTVGLVGFYHVVDYVQLLKTQLESLNYEVKFFPLFKFAKDDCDRVGNYTQVLIEWINSNRPNMLIWSYNCFSCECFQRNLRFPFLIHVYYNPDDYKATATELGGLLAPMNYVLTASDHVAAVAGNQKSLRYVESAETSSSNLGIVVLVRSRTDDAYNKAFSTIKHFAPLVVDADDAQEVLKVVRGIFDLRGIIYTGDTGDTMDVACSSELHAFVQVAFPNAWFTCKNIVVAEYITGYARTLNEVQVMLREDTQTPPKQNVVNILDQILLTHLIDKTFLNEHCALAMINAAIENKKQLREIFSNILLTPRQIDGAIDVDAYVRINNLDSTLFGGNENRAKAHWLFHGERAGFVLCVGHDTRGNNSNNRDGVDSLMCLNLSLLNDLAQFRACPDESVLERIRLKCTGNDALLFSHMNIINTTYLQQATNTGQAQLCDNSEKNNENVIVAIKTDTDGVKHDVLSAASNDVMKRIAHQVMNATKRKLIVRKNRQAYRNYVKTKYKNTMRGKN
jgi:hypothetical protein